MFSAYLDLQQPEELFLNKSMTAYAKMNLKREEILFCIARDFPMMDSFYMNKAELALFKHFKDTFDSSEKISAEWIRVCTQGESHYSENSWTGTQFLHEEKTPLKSAIHFINLQYGVKNVKETYSLNALLPGKKGYIHIQDIEVEMDKDILCKTVLCDLDMDSIIPELKNSELIGLSLFLGNKSVSSFAFEYLKFKPGWKFNITKWDFHSDRTEEPLKAFNLQSTNEIVTEIWMESTFRHLDGTRPQRIQGWMKISGSNPHRTDYFHYIEFRHSGGNIYKSKTRIARLKLGSPVYLSDYIPQYSWGSGSYGTCIGAWDYLSTVDNKISFYDKPVAQAQRKVQEKKDTNKTEDKTATENNLPIDINKLISLEKFGTLPLEIENDEGVAVLLNKVNTFYQTCMKQETTKTVVLKAEFKIKDSSIDLTGHKEDFYCNLLDTDGNLLDTQDVLPVVHESRLHICAGFGSFTSYDWERGRYRIELKFKETDLGICTFEIGDRDILGDFDVTRIKHIIRHAGKSENTENAYEKLMSMAGLEDVKKEIERISTASAFAEKRKKAGLPAPPINLHSCFIGSPGTGKTTVARLLGRIFKEKGLLSSGHVVEESRQTLVGKYYGTESQTVSDAIERAQGGILLIDNAHNLYVEEDGKDPGRHVIECLLNELGNESNRDWMLILSGTDAEMTEMLTHNVNLLSNIPNKFIFKDYDLKTLMHIAESYCKERKYRMSEDAKVQLREVIRRDLSVKDETFGNGRYMIELMDRIVNINLAGRICSIENADVETLQKIEACDIPSIRQSKESVSLETLKELIGLGAIKQSVETHIQYIRMLNSRTRMGLAGPLPPLHMIFKGNPGTGKTTVANLLGEIYASMGVLSCGKVIYVERKDLVGEVIGETESIVKKVLKRAKGNILFIDEAYQLYSKDSDKDYGRIAMECLLTTLSKDSTDLIVILAGYEKEMNELISLNPGIDSRFPYHFHFDDYSIDELLSIATQISTRLNYRLSEEAIERIKVLTKVEMQKKKDSFGNARYIKRLITNKILPQMALRTSVLENPTAEDLSIITAEDIPMTEEEKEMIAGGGFNEKAISEALARLDSMVGMEKVKTAIHHFVNSARYLNNKGEKFVGKGTLKWSFTGNTGTGKSTVSKILAEILKAMNILTSSEITEVKGEEIFNLPEHQCNEILTNAIRKSTNGLLFIDGDSPECRNAYNFMTGEQLRLKLKTLTAENEGVGAIVIAETSSPRQSIARNLASSGVYDYDHTFIFDDYSEEELYRILCMCLDKYGIGFSDDAEAIIRKFIKGLCSNRQPDFANARTMKHLARTIQKIVIIRLSENPDSDEHTILAEDVESFVWSRISSKIGF